MNLRSLTDNNLLQETEFLARQEREMITRILYHLREIERRTLYSTLNLSSLFDYATQKLGYSEAEAYRRIQAMRILSELPEIEESLNSGAISLTNATLAQNLFRREARMGKKVYTRDEKLQTLKKLEGKTTREAERIILGEGTAPSIIVNDRIRPIGETAVEIRFAADQNLHNKIEQLRGLLAHKHPTMSLAELVDKLCDLGLQTWSPEFAAPRKHRGGSAEPKSSDHIPDYIRRAIWKRDQGRCKNCQTQFMLEIDHIQPRALGGSNEMSNLRLLCRKCNRRAAIEVYGVDKIASYVEKPQGP